MALATISHGGKVLQLRTNPNSIRWTYTLNTKVEETYGGRVVQILSANMDDLVVTAEAGRGGWDYLYRVATFMRDMMFDQRQGGAPGIFSYPNRGWEMTVYAVNFPFKDNWNEVAREFTLRFKIQEDVSGVIQSDSIAAEIERLKSGVAYEHNDFNTPPGDPGSAAWPVYGDGAVSADGSKTVDPTKKQNQNKLGAATPGAAPGTPGGPLGPSMP
ncbi:minor tail protein [Gordonia phage RedWattleHog]|uniref:Minor tail protein n=1 Tax=Gordonia phage Stormageddon TaxID=2656541 RepID=A0A649VQY1_9CAUD|nr:minor tail protein [Gordonia phage Stormageddon]QGJ94907.1 minor tail protein [Gordonia phage Stormageddon]QLF83551.1 minor tail protein [Gordonia phage RedWattleHog]